MLKNSILVLAHSCHHDVLYHYMLLGSCNADISSIMWVLTGRTMLAVGSSPSRHTYDAAESERRFVRC